MLLRLAYLTMTNAFAALQRRRRDRCPSTLAGFEGQFVFHSPDGHPLHPEYVLNRFHLLCDNAW